MKAHGRMETYLHTFLTFILYGSEWSAWRPRRCTQQDPPPVTAQYSAEVNIGRYASTYPYVIKPTETVTYFFVSSVLCVRLITRPEEFYRVWYV